MDEKLLKALEIQAEDIEANRQGSLSKRQLNRLRDRHRSRLIPLGAFMMMLVMVILVTLQGIFGQLNNFGEAQYGTLAWGIIAIMAILVITTLRTIAAQWRKASLSISRAELKSVRGPIKHSVEKDDNGDAWHYVRIGSQKFRVIPPVYEAFAPKGKYTIYYTSTTQEVVGAEPHTD